MLRYYIGKVKGTIQSPPRVNLSEIIWSWVGGLAGIAPIGLLDDSFFNGTDSVLIIGSFGASAVLLFGAIKSPLAQPRNLIGGHILSALIGVTAYRLFHSHVWLAAAIAVGTAIAAMHATKTLHPPGGATALIAVIGGDKIHNLGYLYALMPVTVGAAILLIVALIVNNIPKIRKYPEFWI
jgi:CBS-domain-containing membrane protein